MTTERYAAELLCTFAQRLLAAAGLPAERAQTVADTLLAGDLLGHTTHGLALLPAYIAALERGEMTREGEPETIRDTGAALTWNGRYLPGPWLVQRAIDVAMERLQQQPVVTVVIQRSHHIGCLAAYPERATQAGYLMLLSCSDPGNATVAPYGSAQGLYSPNPLAAGLPTQSDPIVFDISMSATANGSIMQARQAGQPLPHPWLLQPDGQTTADPAAFLAEPPATILPLGGTDSGYKGFALGLLVEALTNGLSGYGRAARPDRWGASVFLQLLDPAAFGGREAFTAELQNTADRARAARPLAEDQPVRLPGDRGRARRENYRHHGVQLSPTIMPALEPLATRYKLPLPTPLI